MDATTASFIATYGQDTYERIFEVIYGDATYDDISIREKYSRDVINSYGYAFYRLPNGDEVIVNFEDGNWNGSQITSFGVDVDPVREHRVLRRMVLDEARIRMETGTHEEAEQKVALMKMKFNSMKAVIQEKERDYNYDLFFSPTTKIQDHYRNWMRERYLTIKHEED